MYFNNLKLCLNTNKKFSEIFHYIEFYSGSQKITSFDNEEYIKILKKLNKIEETQGMLELPFLFKENKMYNMRYGHIDIVLKTKVLLPNISIFGTTYLRSATEPEKFENKILQLQHYKEFLIQENLWFSKVKELTFNIQFNHPSFLLYILGEEIKSVKLIFNGSLVYQTTMSQLKEKNGFDFPVIMFDKSLLFDKDAKTINFSRIDDQKITIEYNDIGQCEFNVYCINCNILRCLDGLSGLAYI